LLNLLRLAISSRLSDKDDFRQIILKSESSEINIYREDDDFATQLNGEKLVIQESDLVDKIEEFIQNGFRSIVCKCYSGDMRIEVPSGKDKKPKIIYSRAAAAAETTDDSMVLDSEEASELLKAIEIANSDGSIKADMMRKYVQIDNFIKLIQPLLSQSSQKKTQKELSFLLH
jgi:hypothetical protein